MTPSQYLVAAIIFLVVGLAYYTYSKQKERAADEPEDEMTGSVLAQFTRDLTQEARQKTIEPVVGREKEIARAIEILSRRTKNNPLLLGEPGVGKTAIAEGLAVKLVRGDVPEYLKKKRVLALDLTNLISDTKYRGEFEKRTKRMLDEIVASNREIILFIDEIHMLAQAKGTEGALNVSDIFKPALARGELQVIGATTPLEYEQFIHPDKTLDRRFQPIIIHEPSADETLTVLRGIRKTYEDFHGVRYTDGSLKAAITLSKEFAKQRFLPDRAIDLMDEAGARVNIARSHELAPAVGVLYSAAKSVKERHEQVLERNRALKKELQHIRTLEKRMKKDEELEDIAKKIESILNEIRVTEPVGGAKSVPIVTEQDIKNIVTEWKG